MSNQKRRQTPISEKEMEQEDKSIDDNASEQDMKIQLTNTKVKSFQTNGNAIEPVISRDSNITTTSSFTTSNNFHMMTQEEADLSIKVRKAGDALYDLVLSAIEKAKTISAQKAKELAARDISPAAIAAKKDARDISTLGESVEGLARTFESLMTEMRKQPYSEQVNLLTGYKKLLKEQINVIDSRISMAKRLMK